MASLLEREEGEARSLSLNTRSKQLILEAIDSLLDENETRNDKELLPLLTMNRNRVAKFLGLPRKKF